MSEKCVQARVDDVLITILGSIINISGGDLPGFLMAQYDWALMNS